MKTAAFAIALAATLIAQDGVARQNWPRYGGTPSSWRYSALDPISNVNVSRLAPAWIFDTGQTGGGLQSTPIVIDGILYLSTSCGTAT
jgi:glucose dehydrogenase